LLPYLINLSFLKIHSYGLIIFLGAAVGIRWVAKNAESLNISSARTTHLCYWALFYGLVGGRVLHVVVQ